VSLAGFRVFGFVGARGVTFLINGTLSRKPQEAANTLHIMAKTRYRPRTLLSYQLEGLEGRAEALVGTFNAHAVANTLWAYATMG
jgi:hypothetical protein